MLKLSANVSTLLSALPLPQRIARAAQAGFAGVEIQFPYPYDQTALQQILARHHLACVLINAPAGDLMQGGAGLAAHPARRREFASALDTACRWAEQLKVEAVNILPGRLADGASETAALDTLAANLALAAQQLGDIGVRCTFEAINQHDMPGFVLSSCHGMLAMQARVAHPNLWLQYDLYHMARMGEDVTAQLAAYWPHIGHLQFADLPGRGAPGSGQLPFTRLFRQLAELPYPFWCGAEYRSAHDNFKWKRALP